MCKGKVNATMLQKHPKRMLRAMLPLSAAVLMLWQSSAPLAVNAAKAARISLPMTDAVLERSAYSRWKQYASAWEALPVGKLGDTMRTSGCAVTSAAILCAASGCDLPEGFDPGMLCRFLTANGGFSINGNLQWYVISKLVPDFRFERTETFETKVQRDQIAKLAAYLEQGYYVSVMLRTPAREENGVTVPASTHFVAIDRVENGIVYMFDPASSHDSLYAAYRSAYVESVRLFRKGESPKEETPVEYADGTYETTDRLNFRAAAGLEGEVLDVIPDGTRLDIIETAGEWGKCFWNDREGWVCLQYCKPAIAMYTKGLYCTDGNSLTMRSAPSAASQAVGYLQPRTVVDVTKISGSWGYCTYGEKSGWIALRYCSSNSGSADTGISVRYSTGENRMRLRAAANTQSETLTILETDTLFTVTEIVGDWGRTCYDNLDGWIHLGYCIRQEEETSVVTGDVYTTGENSLRLRAAATTDSETLAFIGADTLLTITEIAGDWGKTVYHEKEGWVHLGYCTLVKATEPEEPKDASLWPAGVGQCVVVATGLNIRQTAGTDGKWIGRAAQGDVLQVVRTEEHWAEVIRQDGTGWVCLGEMGTPYLYLCGDVTLDGAVDAGDIKLMEAYFNGVALLEPVQILAGDLNGDGTVDLADHTLLTEKGAQAQ